MPTLDEELLTKNTDSNRMLKHLLLINSTSIRCLYGCLFICLSWFSVHAQDPLRFKDEIIKLTTGDSAVNDQDLNIFAGSSSFRMWTDLKTDFSEFNVVNRGFGGSEMSDLLYYADQLILAHQPERIFIYEGDNDLASKRPVKLIIENADLLLKKIRAKLPDAEVFFLTPKPSPSRWHLKKEYKRFNRKLKNWTRGQKNVQVIDVWKPLLSKDKKPRPEIFMDDKLHMNREGYALWVDIIKPYLKK